MSKQDDDLPGCGHEMISGRGGFNRAALSLPLGRYSPSHPFPRIVSAAYHRTVFVSSYSRRAVSDHLVCPIVIIRSRVIIASLSSRPSPCCGEERGEALSSARCWQAAGVGRPSSRRLSFPRSFLVPRIVRPSVSLLSSLLSVKREARAGRLYRCLVRLSLVCVGFVAVRFVYTIWRVIELISVVSKEQAIRKDFRP